MGFTLEHIHRTISSLGSLMPAKPNKDSTREYSLKECVFLMAPQLLEKREMGCTTNELVKALMDRKRPHRRCPLVHLNPLKSLKRSWANLPKAFKGFHAQSDFSRNRDSDRAQTGRKNLPGLRTLNNKRQRSGLTPLFLPKKLRSPRPACRGVRLPADSSGYAIKESV